MWCCSGTPYASSLPYVRKCFEEKNTRIGANSNPSLLNVIVPRWVVAILSIVGAILMGIFEHALLNAMTRYKPGPGPSSAGRPAKPLTVGAVVCFALLLGLITARAVLLQNNSSQYA